jgi:metal-dependent hydrolase (beta-lactamase superfamily II)
MHLVRANSERLEATVDALARQGVRQLGPAHCTGIRATAHLWSRLPEECVECSAGSTFTVEINATADGSGP